MFTGGLGQRRRQEALFTPHRVYLPVSDGHVLRTVTEAWATYLYRVCVGADDEDLSTRRGPEVLLHSQHGLHREHSQLQ